MNGYRITPEQWASGRVVVDGSVIRLNDEYVMIDNDPDGAPESMGYMQTPSIRFVTAAFALHSQPFGFTWADVDNVIDVAPDLAERIAALLPPRNL